MTETLKLIQFRAAYNLPVHAGIETGIFARHRLALETAYTPGSLYLSRRQKRDSTRKPSGRSEFC